MIKKILHDNVATVLDGLGYTHSGEFTVETPNNPEHGDFSTNAAMVLAKENKIKPRDLAEKLARGLKKNKFYKKIEIAGPGFINFTLSNSLYQQILWEIRKLGGAYGDSDHGRMEKVLLEFVSANPTGPLNIVNA
ncbi:MAG: arginine--tRNA ligase, partial [Candidatus Syntrophosphaera sp.]